VCSCAGGCGISYTMFTHGCTAGVCSDTPSAVEATLDPVGSIDPNGRYRLTTSYLVQYQGSFNGYQPVMQQLPGNTNAGATMMEQGKIYPGVVAQ
jgi:hypothetical protein